MKVSAATCVIILAVSATVAQTTETVFEPPQEAPRQEEIFKARTTLTMDLRSSNTTSIREIFNTRIFDWKSPRVTWKACEIYRKACPNYPVTSQELKRAMEEAEIELVPDSRVISLIVRSSDKNLAIDCTRAYAEAIVQFTDEENRLRCDRAVAMVHERVEKKYREVDRLSNQAKNEKLDGKIEKIKRELTKAQEKLKEIEIEELRIRGEMAELGERLKKLDKFAKNPELIGAEQGSAGAIADEVLAPKFRTWASAKAEHERLLVNYTEQHPSVIGAKQQEEIAYKNLQQAIKNETGPVWSSLDYAKAKLSELKKKKSEYLAKVETLQKGFDHLEGGREETRKELEMARRVLEELILDENKIRLEAERDNEMISASPYIDIVP